MFLGVKRSKWWTLESWFSLEFYDAAFWLRIELQRMDQIFAYDGEECDDDHVRTHPNKKSRLSGRAQQMAAFVSEAVI